MQRKTPSEVQHKSNRKRARQPRPGTPFSSQERIQQQKAEREQHTAASAALREAAEVCRRAWDFARETPHDTAAWTDYERTYRNLWQMSLAVYPLAPEQRAKLKAMYAAFPPGYEQSYWQAKAGDGRNLEALVLFLEADPYVFRSGYAKEATIVALKQVAEIPPHYAARLRNVILHIVDTRWGQEFRAYCRLAVKVDNPKFRAALEQRRTRLEANYPDVSIRARRVLEALYLKDRMEYRKR